MARYDGNMALTDDLVERLSQVIVTRNMETIAISYLKIKSETVTNLKIAHPGNPTEFNRSILNLWKCMNPGDNQAEVILYLRLNKKISL